MYIDLIYLYDDEVSHNTKAIQNSGPLLLSEFP